MINVPREELGGSAGISLGDTLRFINIMSSYGFQTVSFWQGRGLPGENFVGQGKGDYNAACIPCSVAFAGDSTRVTVTMRNYVSNSANHTFRWAITTQRADRLFRGVGPVGADPRVLAQGSFTPDFSIGSSAPQTYSMPVKNLPNTFFIYLWRSNANYGNIHIQSDVTVRVYQEALTADFRNATPYVHDGTAWKKAEAYITVRDEQDQRVWKSIK